MFGWFKKKSKNGEELASIADNYYFGLNGESVDYKKAVEFYNQADDKKCARASFMLGLCYELGHGVEQDKDTAEAFYMSAQEGGDKNAEWRMMTGELVEPSAPGADYTEDAVNLSLFEGDQALLGGGRNEPEPAEEDSGDDGVHIDITKPNPDLMDGDALLAAARYQGMTGSADKAEEYLELAAMRGNAEAAFIYGGSPAKGLNAKRELDGSIAAKKVMWWLEQAADGGYQEAQKIFEETRRGLATAKYTLKDNTLSTADICEMADKYRNKEDYIRALYWNKAAADRDDQPRCSFWAGYYYFHGQGILKNKKNYRQALDYLMKAWRSNKTIAHCEYYIGRIHFEGGYGIERNYKEALGWFKKAVATDDHEYSNCKYLADTYRKLGDAGNADKWDERARKYQ